jgi:ankyrin repeat protein
VVTPELLRLGARDGACVLNARMGTGRTVLMAAALKGHVKVAKFLLGCGVDPDIGDRDGRSALCHACMGGHTEMVTLLLEAGADTVVWDLRGITAFELACTHGHAAAAGLVLAKHKLQVIKAAEEEAEERRTSQMMPLLRRACVEGDVGIVSLLMQEGNVSVPLGYIVAASARGHAAVVKVLLESPEMMRQEHKAFMPALKSAVAMGQAEVMETLLDRAPSLLRQTDSDKMTLLMTAAAWEQVECVRRLLDMGAGEGLHDGEGWEDVLLICGAKAAQEDKQVEIVRLLLAAAARELRQQPGEEGTARLRAVCHRMLCERPPASVPLVQLLLDQGVDIDAAAAPKGMTPLMAAVCKGRHQVVQVLLERGASWGPCDYRKTCPWEDAFARACCMGKTDVIRVFIEKGAVERYNLEAAEEGPVREGWLEDAFVRGFHAVAQARDVVALKGLLEIGGETLREETMKWERNSTTPLPVDEFDIVAREKEDQTIKVMCELIPTVKRDGHWAGDAALSEDMEIEAPPPTVPCAVLATRLMEACSGGRSEEVRRLLARGAEATWEEKSTLRTPLMSAARAGSVTCVRLLLQWLREQGRWDALEQRDLMGRTALWYACFENHADVVELLMAHGANAYIRCEAHHAHEIMLFRLDKKGWFGRGDWGTSNAYLGKSPLEIAQMREGECLQAIKVHQAHPGPVAYMWGGLCGGSVLPALLRCASSFPVFANLAQNVQQAVGHIREVIVTSCTHSEDVSQLLDMYADGPLCLDVSLAREGSDNETLLCRAIEWGSEGAVEVLLQRGACVEAKGEEGALLMDACHYGDSKMASLLLTYGAKADVMDEKGRTPLMVAAIEGLSTTVAAVLGHPEGLRTLEVKDSHSRTPLWAACKYGHVEVALELLVAGADFRGRGGTADLTPLQLAKRQRDVNIIALLMVRGCGHQRVCHSYVLTNHTLCVYAGLCEPHPVAEAPCLLSRVIPPATIPSHSTAFLSFLTVGVHNAALCEGGALLPAQVPFRAGLQYPPGSPPASFRGAPGGQSATASPGDGRHW